MIRRPFRLTITEQGYKLRFTPKFLDGGDQPIVDHVDFHSSVSGEQKFTVYLGDREGPDFWEIPSKSSGKLAYKDLVPSVDIQAGVDSIDCVPTFYGAKIGKAVTSLDFSCSRDDTKYPEVNTSFFVSQLVLEGMAEVIE